MPVINDQGDLHLLTNTSAPTLTVCQGRGSCDALKLHHSQHQSIMDLCANNKGIFIVIFNM